IGGFFLLPMIAKTLDSPEASEARLEAARTQRSFGAVLDVFSVVAMLSGAGLLGLRMVQSSDWLRTADGITVCLGAVTGLGALFIGIFVLRPRFAKVLGLVLAFQAGGPSLERTRALAVEQGRLVRSARVAAWHLVVAALLMSFHSVVSLALVH
ncbi:MAG: hypothetical protein ACREKE_01905, partial [bacterium]